MRWSKGVLMAVMIVGLGAFAVGCKSPVESGGMKQKCIDKCNELHKDKPAILEGCIDTCETTYR
ncbi:MAG: hypothetical protein H6684_13175 [Deltaproteobacteria bacterium]|nr:hypothetical protein [Deltaproteobacteria bacterium]MCB9489678.1 hypothetical protein [Deltaproteobacteria bacterium]